MYELSKHVVRYRVSAIDYHYDSARDTTSLTTKITMYFDKKPMSFGGTLIMAIDNLKNGDQPFQFVEKGSSGYIAYSRWNKEVTAYKKKSLKVSVDDTVSNACVADFDGYSKSGANDRKSYATFTAKWVAQGRVRDFRVKGTVLINNVETSTTTQYSLGTSSQSVTLKVDEKAGTVTGRWASVSCRM